MRRRLRLALALSAVALITGVLPAPVAGAPEGERPHIVMVTFRGCEEACLGFQDFVASSGLDADIDVRDIGRDRSLLPGLVQEVTALKPDLLVTWGTTVTVGMLGTLDDAADAVADIPAVFMIVADPVGARVVESTERSGRPLITGTLNRVPEETQMRVLSDYRPFDRIGLVYNDTELNAVLVADEIKRVAANEGFEVVERIVDTDAEGNPRPEDIPEAISEIASRDVDFLYVGSSSFILEHADAFTLSALEHDVPVATAYETMVRDSHGLISVASPYYNVGQLAGFQAVQILADGKEPGQLEIAGLDRFTVLVNIDTAHALGLYPPMLMLRYAEIVENAG